MDVVVPPDVVVVSVVVTGDGDVADAAPPPWGQTLVTIRLKVLSRLITGV
jgi:hypothetical protein